MEFSLMQETSDLYQAKERKFNNLLATTGSDGKGRGQSQFIQSPKFLPFQVT